MDLFHQLNAPYFCANEVIDILLSKGAEALFSNYIDTKRSDFYTKLLITTMNHSFSMENCSCDNGDNVEILEEKWIEDLPPESPFIDNMAPFKVKISIRTKTEPSERNKLSRPSTARFSLKTKQILGGLHAMQTSTTNSQADIDSPLLKSKLQSNSNLEQSHFPLNTGLQSTENTLNTEGGSLSKTNRIQKPKEDKEEEKEETLEDRLRREITQKLKLIERTKEIQKKNAEEELALINKRKEMHKILVRKDFTTDDKGEVIYIKPFPKVEAKLIGDVIEMSLSVPKKNNFESEISYMNPKPKYFQSDFPQPVQSTENELFEYVRSPAGLADYFEPEDGVFLETENGHQKDGGEIIIKEGMSRAEYNQIMFDMPFGKIDPFGEEKLEEEKKKAQDLKIIDEIESRISENFKKDSQGNKITFDKELLLKLLFDDKSVTMRRDSKKEEQKLKKLREKLLDFQYLKKLYDRYMDYKNKKYSVKVQTYASVNKLMEHTPPKREHLPTDEHKKDEKMVLLDWEKERQQFNEKIVKKDDFWGAAYKKTSENKPLEPKKKNLSSTQPKFRERIDIGPPKIELLRRSHLTENERSALQNKKKDKIIKSKSTAKLMIGRIGENLSALATEQSQILKSGHESKLHEKKEDKQNKDLQSKIFQSKAHQQGKDQKLHKDSHSKDKKPNASTQSKDQKLNKDFQSKDQKLNKDPQIAADKLIKDSQKKMEHPKKDPQSKDPQDSITKSKIILNSSSKVIISKTINSQAKNNAINVEDYKNKPQKNLDALIKPIDKKIS